MSTGSLSLDILLNEIQQDAITKSNDSVRSIMKRFPSLSEKEAKEIHSLILAGQNDSSSNNKITLAVTAPPTFSIREKPTKIVVREMIQNANRSILITGYSLSDYFSDLVECIIKKSQAGIFVKVYVNQIENQKYLDNLMRYRGKFLKVYNYPKQSDQMSALHAKVISVDQRETIITSANMSYHGQEGNIELGTHIISKEIALKVEDVFTKLLFAKVFEEVE